MHDPRLEGIMHTEFVFDNAPFATCHAATIADTKDDLIAAWFAGEHEGTRDVGIWTSHRDATGWSHPTEVATGQADGRRYACWNPVLFSANNTLLLFYKIGDSPRNWWGMLMTSNDGGLTWSQPRKLPDAILGPAKNKPVQLSNGNLLCGSSSEQRGWRVHMEITPDLGKTWTRTEPLNDGLNLAAIQPTILSYPSGEIQILCRTMQGNIATSRSHDQGRSWSRMELTELPNADSGIDGIVLRDGRALLVYNHSKTARSPLNVAMSPDGKTWDMSAALEDQAGEYSYPAVIQTPDRMVHIVYTWNRTRVKYVVLNPDQSCFSI
jgi:predicted neuraminidase